MKNSKLLLAATLAVSLPQLASAADVEWSGFGSFHYGQTFNKNFLPSQFTNDRANFSNFSSMGLNLSSQVSEKATFYGQIVATDEAAQAQNFDLFAQWAFLSYKLTDSTNLKLGRQLFPALLASEYARVHFLLPARTIPLAVSGINPFISLDGVSYNQEFQTGMGKFSFGVYGGSPKLNSATGGPISTSLSNAYGFQLNLEGTGWKLHSSATKWSEQISFGTAPIPGAGGATYQQVFGTDGKIESTLLTVGGRYDRNNVVFWSEFLNRSTEKASTLANGQKTLRNISAGYAIAGYRFGKVMPRLSYAYNNAQTGFGTGRVKTFGAGMNYQISETSVFKLDLERWVIPETGGGNFTVTETAKNDKTYANAVTAGVDFIF